MGACPDTPSGIRNRALIALMAATGIRVAEALAVREADLDLDGRRLHVRRGKGGRGRHVWVHPDAREPVRAWMRVRKRMGLSSGPCFSSMQGSLLSQSYVRRILPELARAARVDKRVYSDGFRHTFAARSFRAGVTIRSLQVQFGHENISVTVDYLERMGLHSGFNELDRALANR